MRAAFDFALHFARTERRGGVHPIIEHQAVGYALADAKTTIEAARYLSWRACHAVDTQSPAADELCDTGQDLWLGNGGSCDHRSDARRRRR